MNDRGVIQNVSRAQQINDFSGLMIRKITPTDIDGMIEYKNKAYVFIEIKYKDKELPYGQKLALERLATDAVKAGKSAIILVAEHDVEDTKLSVDVAKCNTRSYFLKKNWHVPREKITIANAMSIFFSTIY